MRVKTGKWAIWKRAGVTRPLNFDTLNKRDPQIQDQESMKQGMPEIRKTVN